MKKVLKSNIEAGSKKQASEPRRAGDIITEMFLGDSPLAKGYRKFVAANENSAEKGGEL